MSARPALADRVLPLLAGGLGLMALAGAAARPWLPAWWLQAPSAWPPDVVRGFAGLLGVLLLGLAVGLWRFRRWAWWGALAYGALMAVQLVAGLWPGPGGGGAVTVRLYELAVVACLPRLLRRREDYGVDGA